MNDIESNLARLSVQSGRGLRVPGVTLALRPTDSLGLASKMKFVAGLQLSQSLRLKYGYATSLVVLMFKLVRLHR